MDGKVELPRFVVPVTGPDGGIFRRPQIANFRAEKHNARYDTGLTDPS